MTLLTDLSKFIKLRNADRILFLESFFLQLWIGLLLKFIPFRQIPGLFAGRHSSFPPAHTSQLERIKEATERAAKVSPWKNKCLISSLAAQCMLRRRKIESHISLGVAKDENGRLIAHAWIRAGETEIVPKGGNFKQLYLF